MKFQKYRWSRTYESAEEELLDQFQLQDSKPSRTVVESDSQPFTQSHAQDTTLWCVEGSMIVTTQHATFSLQAGDALYIPATATYTATCGFTGCAFYTQ